MKKIIVLVMMCFGMAQAASANDFKPYVGAGLGFAMFDIGKSVTGAGTSNALAGFGSLGFDYGDYVGAEIRFGTTANAKVSVGGLNYEGGVDSFFTYLAKLQFPVSEQLNIYALAGGTSASMSATITTPGWIFASTGTNKVSWNATSGSFGGGLDFKTSDHFNIGIEYLRYASDISGVTANIKYRF